MLLMSDWGWLNLSHYPPSNPFRLFHLSSEESLRGWSRDLYSGQTSLRIEGIDGQFEFYESSLEVFSKENGPLSEQKYSTYSLQEKI